MSRCCVHDFTLFRIQNRNVDREDLEMIVKWLRSTSKIWTLSLERGEVTGRLHYQGRLSLKQKALAETLNKEMINIFGNSWGKLSVTSNENRKNMFYVMKEDTRVDGPWSDKDMILSERMRDFKPEGWQLQVLQNPRDRRAINIVIDEKGGIGKSLFGEYIDCVLKTGYSLCPMDGYKDMMRTIYALDDRELYIFDIPRAIEKSKLRNLYAAFESLKDGKCFEDRYEYKRRYMEKTPEVWVFTNEPPNRKWLSADRWRFWKPRFLGGLRPVTIRRTSDTLDDVWTDDGLELDNMRTEIEFLSEEQEFNPDDF